jgi:molybdopterin synthase sulfur carrier subunit
MSLIKILYFASLGETLGKSEEQLNTDQALTAETIWQTLNPQTPLSAHILIAVNQEYAEPETLVNAGDELAFFPPVTGG